LEQRQSGISPFYEKDTSLGEIFYNFPFFDFASLAPFSARGSVRGIGSERLFGPRKS